jgi:hypothetical protein
MDSFLQGREHISSNNGSDEADVTVKVEQNVKDLKPEQGEVMSNAHVQTLYENDILKKVIVHCDCGKELVIAFDYKS